MIARMLSHLRPAACVPQTTGSLAWTAISSTEMRAGRYTIIDDLNDPEIRVLVDGEPLANGFGGLERGKGLVFGASQGCINLTPYQVRLDPVCCAVWGVIGLLIISFYVTMFALFFPPIADSWARPEGCVLLPVEECVSTVQGGGF